MMSDGDTSTVSMLAALLLDAQTTGHPIEHLPAHLAPADEDHAYRVQDLVAARLGRVVGWKVGARSPQARPTCAPLLEPLMDAPETAAGLWRVEAELVFTFARDLPPAGRLYERREVVAALAGVSAGIEVVDSRFSAWPRLDPLLMLADRQSHGAMIVGSGTAIQSRDYGRPNVRLSIDGRIIVDQVGGNPAGDPLDLLVWLANALARTRAGLRAGECVATGSFTGMIELPPGSLAEASFEGIGTVAVKRPPAP